jgi:hypothetical protein
MKCKRRKQMLSSRHIRRGLTLVTVSTAVLLLGAGSASAANYSVNDLGDAGDAGFADPTCDTTVAGPPVVCTLRAALDEANNSGADDVITISVPGAIILTNGVLLVGGSTEIDGNAGGTTVDGGNADRVFSTGGPTVTLKDLTVTHGASGSDGAGIFSNSTQMTLVRVAVTANHTTSANGAGIAAGSGAALELDDSTVSSNTINSSNGLGGGIRAAGPLTLIRSTVSGNSSTLDGGGRGGGIDMNITSGTAALTITNSTISGNHSGDLGGGGIFATNSATPVTINSATIAGNTSTGSSGGVAIFSSTAVTSNNSIYAGNTDIGGSSNCTFLFAPASPKNNIDEGTGCGFGSTNGNQENVTPAQLLLGGLANNGGPTQTRALGAGSVAINAATDCASQTQDQRSFTRPQPTGGACDIGAFEVQDSDGDGVLDTSDSCPTQAGPSSNGGCPLPPPSNPPATAAPAAAGPGVTGLRAAALKKCKKKHGAARTKCKKKANLLPV